MDINLDEYDLIEIDSVKPVISKNEETLYDITIDSKDHTFFIKMPNSESYVLVHNCDGANIASMLFGWWKKLAPDLYANHKIYKLNTPIVVLQDSHEKIQKWFYTLDEFKAWEKANPNSKLKVVYLKGLGSLDTAMLDTIIAHDTFEGMLDEFYLDDKSDKIMNDWLMDDAEPRKKYLREYSFDVNMI